MNDNFIVIFDLFEMVERDFWKVLFEFGVVKLLDRESFFFGVFFKLRKWRESKMCLV